MLKFGRGKYFMLYIKDQYGVEYSTHDLSHNAYLQFLMDRYYAECNAKYKCDNEFPDKKLIQLLSIASEISASYIAKSFLYKTMLELSQERENNSLWYKNTYLSCRRYEILDKEYQEAIFDRTYFHIYLPALGQVPDYFQKFCDENGNVIATVLVEAVTSLEACREDAISAGVYEVKIFTKYPLVLSGVNYIHRLSVYSSESVIINDSLNIEDKLFIHAQSILIPDENFIRSKKIHFHCEQRCEVVGTLKAEDIEVKAGHYQGKGTIEADELFILAEDAEQFGLLKTKRSLSLVGLNWTNHPGSQIHAPGGMSIIAEELSDHSLLSANGLSVFATNATFKGAYYLGHYHIIRTESLLKVANNACFLCNGPVQYCSGIGMNLDAQFIHSPAVEVTWEKVIGPKLDDSRYPKLNNYNGSPIFIACGPGLFIKEQSDIFLQSNIFIEIAGDIQVNDANFTASAKYLLDVAASIWQKRFYHAQKIHLKSQDIKTGQASINGDHLIFESESKLILANKNEGNRLSVSAQDLWIKPTATVKFNMMDVSVKDRAEFEKGSIIDCSDTICIKAKRHRNKTKVKSDKQVIEAEQYIFNEKGGEFDSNKLYLAAPWVLSTGRIKAEQCSTTALFSAISGFNQASTFNNNSVISFSPSLLVQTLLSPTLFSLALAVINATLTMAEFACPFARPSVLLATKIAKFAINSAVQAYSGYQQIKNIKQSILAYRNSNSTADLAKLVTAITQTAMVTAVATNSARMNNHSLTAPPAIEPPPLMPMVQSVAAHLLSAFSGHNNYSLININPGVFLGFGSANYSLINIQAGAMWGFSAINNSFFNVDARYGATLGPSSSTGYSAIITGNHYAAFGQNVLNYQRITLDPWIPLPYRHMAIVTSQLSIKTAVTFQHSTISAQNLTEHHSLSLSFTQFKADQLRFSETQSLAAHHSHVNIENLGIKATSSVLIHHSSLAVHTLHNQGQLLIAASELEANQWVNHHEAQLINSTAQIKDLQNYRLLAVDQSALTTQTIQNSDSANLSARSSSIQAGEVMNRGRVDIDDSYYRVARLSNAGFFNADNALLEISIVSNHSLHSFHLFSTRLYTSGAIPSFFDQQAIFSRQAAESEIKAFMSNVPVLYDDGNGLCYQSTKGLTFHDRHIASLLPITYRSPHMTVNGELTTNIDLALLTTEKLNFDRAEVNAQADIYFITSTISVIDSIIKSKNYLWIEAYHSISLWRSYLRGYEISLRAHISDIDLKASRLQGENYLELVAEQGNSHIDCLSKPVQGPFDTVLEWQPSTLYSGGLGHHGVGIAIFAGKEFRLAGSALLSQANNLVEAHGAVQGIPESHQYIRQVQKKSDWLEFHKREVVTRDYQVQRASIVSYGGKNILMSHEDKISFTATDLFSRYGNELYAKKPIMLLELMVSQDTHTYQSRFWGLTCQNDSEHHEASLPTIVANVDPGITRIHTGEDFYARGTVFKMRGEADFLARNVLIENPILQHTIKISTRGLSVSIYGAPLMGSEVAHKFSLPQDPTYAQASQLLASSNLAEALINSVAMSANGVNTAYDLTNAFETNQYLPAIAERYGIPVLTEPNATLALTSSKSTLNYQTLGSASLQADQLTISAGEKVDIGVQTEVTHNMNIAAKSASFFSPTLQTRTHSQNRQVTLASTADGLVNVSASQQTRSSHSQTVAITQIKVGNTFTVNIDNQFEVNAQVEVNELKGNVQRLSMSTGLNSFDSRSKNVTASTSGHVALTQEKSHKTFLSDRSYIKIRQGLKDGFKARQVELTDSSITDEAKLPAGTVTHRTQTTLNVHKQQGVMFDIKEMQKAIDHLTPQQVDNNPKWLAIMDAKTLADAKSKIETAWCLSQEVYRSEPTACGFEAKETYLDSATDTKITMYASPKHRQAFISFRGTAGLKTLIIDRDIGLGKIPRSNLTESFNAFMKDQITFYQSLGYDIYLTGHSAGAAQATTASSQYNIPAMVFENPGIAKANGLNLASVISFQSIPNMVNRIPETTGKTYDYGTVVKLPMTPKDQMSHVAATAVGMFAPASKFLTVPWFTHSAHNIEEVGSRLKYKQFEKLMR